MEVLKFLDFPDRFRNADPVKFPWNVLLFSKMYYITQRNRKGVALLGAIWPCIYQYKSEKSADKYLYIRFSLFPAARGKEKWLYSQASILLAVQ